MESNLNSIFIGKPLVAAEGKSESILKPGGGSERIRCRFRLHPWNQLVVPLKDYRGALPGLTPQQELEWSVLDTFDATSMKKWCKEAGLVDVDVQRGGNGIEVRARTRG